MATEFDDIINVFDDEEAERTCDMCHEDLVYELVSGRHPYALVLAPMQPNPKTTHVRLCEGCMKMILIIMTGMWERYLFKRNQELMRFMETMGIKFKDLRGNDADEGGADNGVAGVSDDLGGSDSAS